MSPLSHNELDRRAALKFLAGGMATSLAACSKPHEEIVPYVDQPERLVPGESLKFATTLPFAGYGRGVLAISIDGRPIKVEGNPRHPASVGATDIFAEAEIMALYDPDRSKAPRHGSSIASWDAFGAKLQQQMQHAGRGAGLRIVTGRITSPTLLRQIDDLLKRYPEAKWVRYEPIHDDAARGGSRIAFGRPLDMHARLADAAVVVALDADPLGPGPHQIAYANGFAQRRKLGADPFLRLYAVEGDCSLTGANADHRLALHPALIPNVASNLAAILRGGTPSVEMPAEFTNFTRVVAADLAANRGRALVLAGSRQPPEMHALCHWINAQLQAPIDFIEPVDPHPQGHAEALQNFAHDLANGAVTTLLIIGANPAYDAPPALGIATNLKRVSFSAHLGTYDDETATLCHWRLPLSHALESWSDLRACDGTASIGQPLIEPLYDTRAAPEVLAMIMGDTAPSAYDLVRQTWQPHAIGDFDSWWRQVLHDGTIANSAAQPVSVGVPAFPDAHPAQLPTGRRLVLMPDSSVWDGCFANNPWLQECPQPLTKTAWGNAFHLTAEDAARLGVATGDVIQVQHGAHVVRGPVLIRDGQVEGVIAATLGYGRTRVGAIGNGIGFNIAALRPADLAWHIDDVSVLPTPERQPLASLQNQFKLEGEAKELMPTLTLAEIAQGKRPPDANGHDKATLYPPVNYDTYAWAMVIDTSLCIGCNACVVSCQAENNVGVVGPEEVSRGRIMHWLRIDTYDVDHRPGFQPVPCMHCEHAPCEPVCPVEASVHDGEGLNVQVYNRCIGTRFCQANCPYKVRRFNWFGYTDGEEPVGLGAEVIKAARNPDVTVRARGVMEKCTYCVQRISRARRTSEKENRDIADGEVVTACQAACPTRAITFGDRNKKDSRVNDQRQAPHHYALLGHLGTRPRTTYLARLRNLNPSLQEPQA